jgi:hypothetical protein
VTISHESVARPATNLLVRFVASDGVRETRVIAKWAPVYPENNEGLTEFHHYRRFHRALGHRACVRCPLPLAFLRDENVLLTREDPGVPFRDVLRSVGPRSAPIDILRTCVLCARWLRQFHHLMPLSRVPVSSAIVNLKRLWPDLSDANRIGDKLNLILTGDLRRRIQSNYERLCECTSLCSSGSIHRDFGPGNILCTEHNITVLDAASNQIGPQLIDVAEFVAYLYLLPVTTLHTRQACRKFARTFLDSYLTSSVWNPGEEMLFRLLAIVSAIRTVERQIRRLEHLPRPARSIAWRYLALRYSNALNCLIDDNVESLGLFSKISNPRAIRGFPSPGGSFTLVPQK